MANFYATYSPSAASGANVNATITSPIGQKVMAASVSVAIASDQSAIPITGSITATNPSVGVTGSAVPADATYVGMTVAGDLTGMVGTVNGLKVDGSAVTQPVSGSVSVSNFPATQPVSGTVTANAGTGTFLVAGTGTAGSSGTAVLTVQGIASGTALPVSGSVTVTQATGTNLHVVVDSAPSTAVTGTVTANAGTGTFTTDQTTAAATFQDGSITAGSLTTSFATVLTTGGVLKHVDMRNNTNGIVIVSLNAGSTNSYTLDPGDSVSLDLKINGSSIAASTALQAKYSGSAPTTGNIRINGFY